MQWSHSASRTYFLLAFTALLCSATSGMAADDDRLISLGDGKMSLTAPEGWNRVKPQNNVIQYEFAVPAAKGDEKDGRVTITGAGGSVDANIERWIGQFSQPDGSDTKKSAKTEQKKVAGQEVHLVDIAGTFKDQPGGPFSGGPAVEHKGYRMLSAIIVSKDAGSYFVKFYGPDKTVSDNRKNFEKLVESLTVK
jgi:hypothetical protein